VLKHKSRLTSLDGHAIKWFYILQTYCSGLEPEERPPVDAYHHKVKSCYRTLNHSCFTSKTPFNRICPWQRDLYASSNHTFFFWWYFPFLSSSSFIMQTQSLKKFTQTLMLCLVPWLFKCMIPHLLEPLFNYLRKSLSKQERHFLKP